MTTVIRGRRVLCPDGERAADIIVDGGRIAGVEAHGSQTASDELHDCGSDLVMPGVIDTHVHINQPGRTHWEGFDTATRAAAAGGVTTLVDMPLNCVPATTTQAALMEKLAVSPGLLHVDVGFWGGVVPGNASQLADLVEAGVLGFKCFLVPSGVDEFEWVQREDLELGMPILQELGTVLLAHSELPGPLDESVWSDSDPTRHDVWLASRPPAAEVQAIEMLVELCRATGCRVHIVHLSAAEALPTLREARKEGLPLTVETCPHYLTFAAEEIEPGRTEYKCAPPIRSADNRERLWQALVAGDIDFVVTDHSPSPIALKGEDGSFAEAWGGIASLQVSLSAVWTEARRRDIPVESLPGWLCQGPAKLAGLDHAKGQIAPGMDADLVVWDPESTFEVDPALLQHRHPITPYSGRTLHGVVKQTWVRGKRVYNCGEFCQEQGRPVLNGDSELARLNRLQWLPDDQLKALLLACCGATRWAEAMLATRPWRSLDELLESADQAWEQQGPDSWLEAFEAHPRIGQRKAAQDRGEQARSWSENEQSGTRSASDQQRLELERLNEAYQEQFGFIFLIFASGKSTDEMLAALRSRLDNDRDTELEIAAREQHAITRLRLEKLVARE